MLRHGVRSKNLYSSWNKSKSPSSGTELLAKGKWVQAWSKLLKQNWWNTVQIFGLSRTIWLGLFFTRCLPTSFLLIWPFTFLWKLKVGWRSGARSLCEPDVDMNCSRYYAPIEYIISVEPNLNLTSKVCENCSPDCLSQAFVSHCHLGMWSD